MPGKILSSINSPADLRKLGEEVLPQLADELRAFILDVVSVHPGHLGSSLGVVELTIALHYVFNTPYDKLIWDVGHQAYGHKILTGRRDVFHTNRMLGGISGFPKMAESEYDAFGTGHASTSISAALGMAVAARHNGDIDRQHIAVIGDGAMTGGMALEGLNNAGVSSSNIIVILNDNGISIDKSVGALSNYLLRMSTSRSYNKLKSSIWDALGKVGKAGPNTQKLVQKIEGAIKSSLLQGSNLFEAMNFRYFGPVDGHDIGKLTKVLDDLKNIPGPKLLHVITKKGKGFEQAEREQTVFHAPGRFNRKTGELQVLENKDESPTYQQVFGEAIVELADKNDKIIAITPAMPTGSSLIKMMSKYPGRVFDVGISEQHAVTFAAGLAIDGMKPFCTIYSTFLQRAFDQVIHDVALQKLNVVFCIDRAGLVGGDGATHHGAFDLAYLNLIPNIVLAAPLNKKEFRNMLFTASEYKKGPIAIRYPRGKVVSEQTNAPFEYIEIGKGNNILKGESTAILTLGHTGNYALEAAETLKVKDIRPAIFNMRFLKPLDEELLHDIFNSYKKIITVEDGTIVGGLGSAIVDFSNANNYENRIVKLGIPDNFVEQGDKNKLIKLCGFDAESIAAHIETGINNL
ncbi:MAG: 1-deoxy-D-xylulose-5-phosphate synthase [Chlorobi bacterium]|nr:1-deoxy-D-xylulose-5-phosphate synthase [Chlorobiota bacterium]